MTRGTHTSLTMACRSILVIYLCWVGWTTHVVSAVEETQLDAEECPSGTEALAVTGAEGVCVACRVGYFREQGQQAACTQCPEGFITMEVGAGRRENCNLEIGHRAECRSGTEWHPETETCEACPLDTYRDQNWDFWCMPCPEGTATLEPGALSVSQCNATEVCPAGTEAVDGRCEPCPRNSFRAHTDGPECWPCPDLHVTLFIGATSQFHCMPSPSHELSFSGEDCPSGTQFDEESRACYLCPRNSFRRAGQQAECEVCPHGLETLYQGAVDEEICVRSQHVVEILNSIPIDHTIECPLGMEWDDTMPACLPCPLGTYRNSTSYRLCQQCPYNSSTPHTGTINQAQCGAALVTQGQTAELGTGACLAGSQWSESIRGCVPCPHGRYSTQGISCQPCPSGTTTPYLGATLQAACTLPVALDVPVPFFDTGQCPSGSEWDGALQSCQACPTGTFRTHQSFCEPCPTGFTTMGPGAKQSSLCFVPAHGPAFLPGSSDGCPAGYEGVSQDWCRPCGAFYYKDEQDWGACRLCPINHVNTPNVLQRYTNPPTAVARKEDCPPMVSILHVSPSFGPQSGGTILHLEMDLSTARPVRVTEVLIGTYPCRPFSHFISGGILSCQTSPVRGLPLAAPLTMVTEGGLTVTSAMSFTYKADPVVTSLDRTTSFDSGTVFVRGNNLQSVPSPVLLMYPTPIVDYEDSTPLQWPCHAISNTQLKCTSESARRRRRRRASDPASRLRRDVHSPSREYTIGLALDGVGTYGNLSKALPDYGSMALYPDPQVYRLEESPKVLSVTEPKLHIRGAGLDQGIRLSDITVNAGDCQGRVSNLAFNALLVELCSDLEIGKDYDLEVHIATLTFSIGQVRLEVSSAAASTDDHDSFLLPLLLSLVVCLLIFVFCAVVLIWWAKRGPGGTKMAAVKPEPEPQAIPDADSEDVTDAGSLPPMPVQSVFGHTRITDRGQAMRQLALPEEGTLTVHLVEPSNRKSLMRYHIPDPPPLPETLPDGTT